MTDRPSFDQQTRTRRRTRTAARADILLDRVARGSLWRAYSVVGASIFLIMGAFTILSVV